MLPTPVVTDGPPLKTEIVDTKVTLSVDLENSAVMKIRNAFASALQPLIASINSLKAATVEALAPDPEAGVDRGKDLINLTSPSEGADPEVKTESAGIGPFGAAIAALGAALLFFKDEVMGIINAVNFPMIIKALKFSFKIVFTPLRLLIGAFKFGAKVMGKIGPTFMKVVKTVTGVFSKLFGFIGKVVKGILGLLGPFGAVLKMLFFPVTIIMGIIDGIKGFMEGYKDGGILDGIFTAIGNIIGGLVGLPLDLIKNIIAFIAEKLGFENIAEAMKDFSFKDAIKNIFGGIVDFFANIPKFVEKGLRALGKAGNFIADKIFGKDQDNEIKKREKVQAKAQKEIDSRTEELNKLDEKEKAIDKSDASPATKARRKKQIQRKRQRAERKLIEAKDKQDEAAQENVALKTNPVSKMMADAKMLQEKIAAGTVTTVEQAEEAIGRKLMPKEKELIQNELDKDRNIKDDLETKETREDIADEVMGKKPRRRRRRGREKEFAVDVAKEKMGVPLDAPGVTTVQMVEGKLVEGKALDAAGDPKANAFVSAPSDNSTTDNSTTNNNNNVTNNNYGGGGGSMDTENRDGSLFSATKYASP